MKGRKNFAVSYPVWELQEKPNAANDRNKAKGRKEAVGPGPHHGTSSQLSCFLALVKEVKFYGSVGGGEQRGYGEGSPQGLHLQVTLLTWSNVI